jgi:hypothetical protein
MVTTTATLGGALSILVGLIGVFVPGFMAMHLTMVRTVLLLLSGAVALYFGLRAPEESTRTFCVWFGAGYGLLGLLGLIASGDNQVLTVLPGTLVLGKVDHLMHLIFGLVFLYAGWAWRPTTRIRLSRGPR